MKYDILCASTVDIDKKKLDDRDIKCVNFKYIIDGVDYDDDFFASYDYQKFYNDISNGMEPTTSQVGYGCYEEAIENSLKNGRDIMIIALSSGISGDFETLRSVCADLNEKYLNNKAYALDSLCASAGYGMLVLLADDNRKKGMTIEENVKWVEENKLKIHHWFISTDLTSFIRGGRISKTSGFFGTMLKICPLMCVATDGSLLPLEKIRTKSKAMEGQLNKMLEFAQNGIDYDGYCFISNSAVDEDAKKLASMIEEKFPKVKVVISHVGTTIGSHTGQGTIALFFVGSPRTQSKTA